MNIPQRGTTATILIIDDVPANLAVMVDQLECHGYRVAVAEEGEEGLERAELIRPDLILLDVMMPGIDGFETCRRLKGNGVTQDIPVIFMTALSDTADKVRGFEAGAVDYVTKPLRIDEVLARVNTHLTLRAMQALLEAKNLQLSQQIRERERKEYELQYQATHDRLTDLPNRVLLHDRLQHAIANAQRDGTALAVMFIDLDKFKGINDTYGHDVGDDLLKEIARRIQRCVRESDTVARLGGDEFVCLIETFQGLEFLTNVARRIGSTLSEPVTIAGITHRVFCSIGISIFPDHGDSGELLLRQADIAMYHAKKLGAVEYQYFDEKMHADLVERINVESALRGAVARGELVLHYQPQVDLGSDRIVALEALARWDSPTFGLVGPDVFIPIAEESKLIHVIGDWVLETACAQISQWRRDAVIDVPVAINLAAPQLSHAFVERLADALQRHGLHARQVELELTEGISMKDPETTIELMHRLKQIGVSLAIDDFGTGFSNLSYLKRFPVDKLKIDGFFTQGITNNPSDRAIVTAVLRLAQSLNMSTVAEGVETQGQLRFLVEEGCDVMQGYYFCRPMPADQLVAFLATSPSLDLSELRDREYQRRALLVDDDPEIFASFQPLAALEGVELAYAADSQQAYEHLAQEEIGVVISDVRLQGENGISLLETVRKMYPRIIRVMITGYGSRENLAQGINRANAHRFISKPWDPDEVLNALKESFRQYER